MPPVRVVPVMVQLMPLVRAVWATHRALVVLVMLMVMLVPVVLRVLALLVTPMVMHDLALSCTISHKK